MMFKSLNIIFYISVIILFSVTNSYSEETAVCQSESDCEQVCEEYEEGLNNDENLPDVYNCSITGYLETGTIEPDGTTQAHTEYNCLCVAIGKKGQDGSDDGDDGKPEPPVILNPLIPDFPGGVLPPDNGFAECIAKANNREEEMKLKCTSDFKQDWQPELAEEHRRFFALGKYLRCFNKAEKIGSEMRKECHKKWSKKSIGDIIPLQNVK